MKQIWKMIRLLLEKGEKRNEIAKGHFSKIIETARWQPPRAKGRLFRTFNSDSFNFKGGLCNRRTGYCPYRAPCPGGEQFPWFLKNYLLRFHLILLFFWLKQTFFFMCLVRSIIANLCSIVIHFCASDFNVCCSEEVISFFWRSVYIYTVFCMLECICVYLLIDFSVSMIELFNYSSIYHSFIIYICFLTIVV